MEMDILVCWIAMISMNLLNGDDFDADGYSSCEGDCDDNDPRLGPWDVDGDSIRLVPEIVEDDDVSITPRTDNDGDGFVYCDDCDDNDALTYVGNAYLDLYYGMHVQDADEDGYGADFDIDVLSRDRNV